MVLVKDLLCYPNGTFQNQVYQSRTRFTIKKISPRENALFWYPHKMLRIATKVLRKRQMSSTKKKNGKLRINPPFLWFFYFSAAVIAAIFASGSNPEVWLHYTRKNFLCMRERRFCLLSLCLFPHLVQNTQLPLSDKHCPSPFQQDRLSALLPSSTKPSMNKPPWYSGRREEVLLLVPVSQSWVQNERAPRGFCLLRTPACWKILPPPSSLPQREPGGIFVLNIWGWSRYWDQGCHGDHI